MFAVIYARYSDSKQREESIEGQLKVCHAYCKEHGYTVVKEYIDRAISGKTDDRVQFRKMIQDSKKKQFDVVVVYSIDRFGRNLKQGTENEFELNKNGAVLLSATENFTDGPSGIMHRNILMSFAQYYSDELSQKVTRGMNVNAEKCLSNGGTTPLGYKIENHKYVIDEKTAPIVQEIFEKYANGMSIKNICDDLNSRQIKNTRGSEFKKNSFNAILKNRKYLGIYIYDGIEVPGGIPQIINEDLFNKVADRMKVNKVAPARSRAKAEYLLTQKLFCGHCKELMIGHSSNKISKGGIIYNYYKCKNSGRTKPCKKKMVYKDYIEDVVIKECKKLLTPSNIKKIAYEVVSISKSYNDDSELNRLKELRKTKETEERNLLDALRTCDKENVRDIIFKELDVVECEIKELEAQIHKEENRHNVISEKQVRAFLTEIAKGDEDNIVYRRTLINVFVNKIFLYDDKFTITFNSGDEEVTITDKLLSDIENSFCVLNKTVYQKQN